MPKGSSSNMQNQINTQGGGAQNTLTPVNNQTRGQYGTIFPLYGTSAATNLQDYGNIIGGYNNFLAGGNPGMTGGGPPMVTAPTAGKYNVGGQPYTPPSLFTPSNRLQTPPPGSVDTQTGRVQPQSAGQFIGPGFTGATQSDPTSSTGQPYQIQASGATDTNSITGELTKFYNSLGVQPTGRGTGPTDIAYYADQIAATGGLTPGNVGYWTNRIQSDMKGGGSSGGNNTSAIGGFQDFAQTGGFTPQQIQDLRARAVSPIRAAQQQASDAIQQNMGISGGYSPNTPAALAQNARQGGYNASDALTNANASIAQMIQQGRLGGLQGLTGAQLGALAGETGAYGAAPGLTGTFGNQLLGTNQQALTGSSLQNNLAQIILNAQAEQAKIPGDYQQALGNIGGTIGLGGDIAGVVNDLIQPGGLFGPGLTGYNPTSAQQNYWASGNTGPI